jgi:hypothetical protein
VDKDSRLIYLARLIWEGRDMDKLLTYLSGKINRGGKGDGQTIITTYSSGETKGSKWARGRGLDNIINGREGV